MYFRYYSTLFVFAIAYVLGFVIHPVMYIFFYWCGGGPFWFWANRSEKDKFESWHGDEKWRGRYGLTRKSNIFKKFFVSYIWMAIRNPHWNLKHLLYRGVGKHTVVEIIELTGDDLDKPLKFKSPRNLGKQHIITECNGRRYFRKSKAEMIDHNTVKYSQYGGGPYRYHFKNIKTQL